MIGVSIKTLFFEVLIVFPFLEISHFFSQWRITTPRWRRSLNAQNGGVKAVCSEPAICFPQFLTNLDRIFIQLPLQGHNFSMDNYTLLYRGHYKPFGHARIMS